MNKQAFIGLIYGALSENIDSLVKDVTYGICLHNPRGGVCLCNSRLCFFGLIVYLSLSWKLFGMTFSNDSVV